MFFVSKRDRRCPRVLEKKQVLRREAESVESAQRVPLVPGSDQQHGAQVLRGRPVRPDGLHGLRVPPLRDESDEDANVGRGRPYAFHASRPGRHQSRRLRDGLGRGQTAVFGVQPHRVHDTQEVRVPRPEGRGARGDGFRDFFWGRRTLLNSFHGVFNTKRWYLHINRIDRIN